MQIKVEFQLNIICYPGLAARKEKIGKPGETQMKPVVY